MARASGVIPSGQPKPRMLLIACGGATSQPAKAAPPSAKAPASPALRVMERSLRCPTCVLPFCPHKLPKCVCLHTEHSYPSRIVHSSRFLCFLTYSEANIRTALDWHSKSMLPPDLLNGSSAPPPGLHLL